ncbi:ATP-dependent RNA helicase DHX33-like [Lineus longissimus]|uniref:ATP-dependent RNA helicase DHX33-like n=1 Tax=Lineus longissimus TaxID=88925 RepID=UPI002B4DC840
MSEDQRRYSQVSPANKKRKIEQVSDYEGLKAQRRQLPIYPARSRLIHEVQKHSSVIVIGETGSGKTTQIPQYLLEANVHRNKIIACTQPRRVAAITVAQRVAEERGSELGKQVGYTVRFDDMSTHETRIRYMTDGMLLREAILDPLLKRYSVVILDEAHERTIHTDVLFGVIKAAQKHRKTNGMLPLKIVVMSATMDVDHFSHYFNSAPVLYIEGRQFPVEVMYSKEHQSDYLFSALVTVFQIHKEAPAGHDILVFLTGQEEIESMVRCVHDVAKDLNSDAAHIMACPLYAALPAQQQLRVFQETPPGTRKVIISTNIAETSITIHGIKFVVDAGMVKAKSYNPSTGLDLLKVQHVSKAQAWQRTGRAGRESAGACYRLYTEPEYEAFRTNTIPEIQRCNLASVLLQLLAMGIHDLVNFDFMDRPSTEAINNAIEQLVLLEAVEKEDILKLTDLGKKMSAFPLDPRYSKVILKSKDFNCLEEILTIVSLLSVESVMLTPQNKRDEALAARRKFVSNEGDHVTLLNIYKAYKGVKGNKQWCQENYVNVRNLKMGGEVRKQLRDICQNLQLPFQSCGRDTTNIRKCMAYGFFMNSAELLKDGVYKTLGSKKTVAIHPSSALFMSKPACVVYNELVKTTKSYMRDLCLVDPDWLNEAAPNFFKRKVTLH